MKKLITPILLLCASACAQASSLADDNAQLCQPAPSSSSSSAAQAAVFSNGDAKTGEALFEQYRCNSCHIDKVGGDGSAIFTHPDRMVDGPDGLVRQMVLCSGAIGKTLTVQEQQHLGAYLDQRYYKFNK